MWERYGLFSLSGNDARHGGGKKDLSMLMLYAAADRYLKHGGRLGMVITQTLFQTKGAGDGFRRFRLGQDGPPLRVLRVDDMVALRPFGDAANWTSTIVLEKGAATEYPCRISSGRRRKGRGEREEGRGRAGSGGEKRNIWLVRRLICRSTVIFPLPLPSPLSSLPSAAPLVRSTHRNPPLPGSC